MPRFSVRFALAAVAFWLSGQAFAQADLGVTTSDNPDPVQVGATVDYTINVSNASGPGADGVRADIFYSAALTPVPQGTAGWTCTGVSPISCSLNATTLAGGANAPALVLRFQAPPTPQTVQISVTAAFLGSDLNPANNTLITQGTQVVVGSANLNAVITPSVASANVGTPISFTTQISNLGPGNAPNTVVNGVLSGAIQFSSFSTSAAWSCSYSANGGLVQCNYQAGSPTGTLANGVTASSIVINGVAGPGAGAASLTMTPSSSANDPSPGGASASIAVNNPPPPSVDLSLTKSVIGTQPIGRGQPFAFRLQVTNSSASNQQASGVTINDPLPTGITLQSASGTNWNCTGNVVCTFSGTLAIGQTSPALDLNVVYNLPVPTGGSSVTNVASVSGNENDPQTSNNSANASATLRPSSDLSITLAGAANSIVGNSFAMTATAGNAGPDDAPNAALSVAVGNGLTINSVVNGAGWSCAPSGQNVGCSRTAFNTGAGGVAATINVTAASAGSISTTANLSTTGFDPNSANNSDSLTTIVAAASATLGLTVNDSADPVATGTEFEYILALNNAGNIAQNGLVVSASLPNLLSFRGFSGAGWTCTGGAGAGATVNCTNPGPLAPAATTSLRIGVRAESAGTATIQAQAQSAQATAPVNATESTTINESLTLRLEKTATPTSVNIGGEVSFALTVSNTSATADANGLVLIDELPTGVAFRSVNAAGWTCTQQGQTVDCRRSSLQRNNASTVTILTEATAAGSFVNRANLSATNFPANLIASAPFSVAQAPSGVDLVLELSDTPDPVSAGETFDLVSRIVNFGPQTATGVVATLPLAAGLEPVSFAGSGWTCTFGLPVTCNLASLAVNGQTTLSVRVRAPQPGTMTNSVTVSSQQLESTVSNNTDTETTTIQAVTAPQADLQVTATAPATAAAGANVEIAALLRNRGPSAAANVVLRVVPNGPLTLASGGGTGFTCTLEGTALVCRGAGLPVNQVADIRIAGQIAATASGAIGAALNVSAATPDPVATDNAANVSINVTVPPPQSADLSITKTDSVDPVLFGEGFSYALTVRNAGPSAAAGVTIRDTLPAGLTLVSASGAGLTCSGTTVVDCRLAASLPAGQSVTATLQVTAPTTAGVVTNEATVSATTSDPQSVNNRATQETTVRAPDGQAAANDLEENIDPGDPIVNEAVAPTVALCTGSSGQVAAFCNALLGQAAAGTDVTEAVRAIYPEEVLAQFTSLNQLSTTQFFNVDARMAELRGGGGGFSLSGLTVINGTQAIPLSLFSGLLSDDEPAIGGSGDLISPWGFFANGTISRGDQEIAPGDRDVVQDFDSIGVTAGVDYRFSARLVLGAALGYNRFSSGLTDAGELDTDGITLTGYGSYYLNEQIYVDSRLSYGRVSLDQQRRVRATLGNFSVDETARGDTNATQLSFATSIGYHINRGGWTITPNAYLRYVQSDVDGFVEEGSEFAVRVGSQDVDSLVYGVGLQVNRAFSLDNGVLVPSFDLIWSRESKADDTVVDAQFVRGDVGEIFFLRPETPDRSYGSLGFGLVYILANGRQAYLQWRESIGNDGLDSSTLNLGARFEF